MRRFQGQIRVFALALLTVAAVAVGILNLREQQRYRLPDDGVLWLDSEGGAVAAALTADTPAGRAGLRPGDILVSINGHPIQNAPEAGRRLFQLGAGSEARYEVLRRGSPVELDVLLEAQERPGVRPFLQIAGVFYLLLGLFVLWRRSGAPATFRFYLFCLASFVLFVFSYTGQLDTLDWTVYWSSVAALLLQPAFFAQFCCEYSQAAPGLLGAKKRNWAGLLWGVYGAAAALGLLHLAVARGVLRVSAPLAEVRWWLDRLEMGYLAGMYLLGMALLAIAYRETSSRLGRKQVAWILGGSVLAVGPFALGYAAPYFLGAAPTAWMNLSALSLVLLPIVFAYAIVRYRLLDVEVVLGRGLAYTLATGTLVGVYLGVVALAGDFFRVNFPASGTVGLVLAVIATGLLFQPLQRWIQAKLAQYFLRKRYEYREALLGFGRELSAETNLDRMIASLLDQLAERLQVRRAAVFVANETEPPSFDLRGAVGLDGSDQAGSFGKFSSFGFLGLFGGIGSARRDRLFFADWDAGVERELGASGEDQPSWREAIAQLQLHYYFACRTKNRVVAVLGVGKTRDGEFLSDEDTALLETLSGYLAIAIENTTLVESLAAKASQYERLQQFSENILESINVGLLAVDLEDRVEAVNTPLELMYPLPFREARGKKLSQVLPPDLMEHMDRFREDGEIHTLFRHRVRSDRGEERVFNIVVAPLLSKNCDAIGRLLIFDDVTDRVSLEGQLAQSEKLSSVGLLAAGVAHEVNTPLTVISTQAQMLAKQLPPGERSSKILEKIISQTFRASEIVNSLLNFSRTQGTTFAPLELNKIISETLLLLDHQFKTTRIEVESLLDPSLPPVSGNSGKLQQVFLNLFLNAKDAMPNGGRLRVVTWAEDSVVRIEISDTGAGIPSEHMHRIFDPFFTTKGPGRGTGLGLSVS
ncbi:MAG: hypothetical protein A3J28_14465, partial [Acidobacteria bacterium RIFCSPLOWO2_12_FULL_60_22]